MICRRPTPVQISLAAVWSFLLLIIPARLAAQPQYELTRQQPNILWIIAEDMGPELSVYGTPEVRTPNLDRLARRGMLFTRAFATSPVCSPSRSAFNTGMYQTTIGAHNHRSHRPNDPSPYPFPLPDSVRIISDWLRHAGYFTANIEQFPEGVPFEGTGKTDWNFSYAGDPFDSNQWSDLKANQPFYAQVNFPETHRGHAWDTAHERTDNPADPDKVSFPPYYPEHPVTRKTWAQYLNAVMALDEKVGTVLQLLEEEGLAESTIVVFMADHGRAMPRGKQWPYDSGLRVPLIMYWPAAVDPPARYEAGTRSDRLVSLIDVTATTLAMAGQPKPHAMQGRVLMGPGAEAPRRYTFGGRDRGDETVDRMRTVRSGRYRYVRNYYPERPYLQRNRYKEANYPILWVLRKMEAEGKLEEDEQRFMAESRPEEELYDLRRDPYETNDLADAPGYQAILKQLRGELDEWIERTNDQGRFPEDPEVVEFYRERMIKNYSEEIERLREKWELPASATP